MYTVESITGAAVSLDVAAKITSVAGVPCENYLVEMAPYAVGMKRRARILAVVPIEVRPYIGLNNSGIPQYGAAVMVKGQLKTDDSTKRSRLNADLGPDVRETKQFLYFNNTNQALPFGVARGELAGPMEGYLFPGGFTVRLAVQTLTGGNVDVGIPGVASTTYTSIDALLVQTTEQYAYAGGIRQKRGDAKLVIKRDAVTRAQLEGAAFIEIAPVGDLARRYQLWNGGEGLSQQGTYHWCIYLQRLQ